MAPTFRSLYEERLRLKVVNPLAAESLKLTMNSAYGRFAMVDTKHDVKTVSNKDLVCDKLIEITLDWLELEGWKMLIRPSPILLVVKLLTDQRGVT